MGRVRRDVAVIEVDDERAHAFFGEPPGGGLDLLVDAPPLVEDHDAGMHAITRR